MCVFKVYLVFLCVSVYHFDFVLLVTLLGLCLQCFDAVGWAAGRASGL